MQLQLKIAVEGTLQLPLHYNHLVQSAIYNNLDRDTAQKIHEEGFPYEKRNFRFFTFSRLMGTYRADPKAQKIFFSSDIGLIISSPLEMFCTSLLEHFLKVGYIRLGERKLELIEVKIKQEKIVENHITFRTLSPVVTYSTIIKPDNKKYTYYFRPGEPEFTRLINENLKKKYFIIHKTEDFPGEIMVNPINQPRLSVIKYKGIVIKVICVCWILGPSSVLQVALDTGIGGKNSQGFGCIALA